MRGKLRREIVFLIAGIALGFAICSGSFMLTASADELPEVADEIVAEGDELPEVLEVLGEDAEKKTMNRWKPLSQKSRKPPPTVTSASAMPGT